MIQRTAESVARLGALPAEDLQVGTTPKTALHHDTPMTLYHYAPSTPTPHPVPLLITYALVNRPYMVDLQPDRSLIHRLLELGFEIYLIDWGYPTRNDRWLSLDDIINGWLAECVDLICQRHGRDDLNLLGICQGGVFSLCYTALHPERVAKLVTMVTPVDFHVSDGLLNVWMGGPKPSLDPRLMVQAFGNIPGDLMNFGFLMLKPFELGVQKYLALLDLLDDPAQAATFLRMERWIFDSPDQAGEAWRQFMEDFYIGNKLIKGEVSLGGRRVNLQNIHQPLLNLYAENDHLVPPTSSLALGQYTASRAYRAQGFPVGHIGMYVSGRVQNQLAPLLADWLKAEDS